MELKKIILFVQVVIGVFPVLNSVLRASDFHYNTRRKLEVM